MRTGHHHLDGLLPADPRPLVLYELPRASRLKVRLSHQPDDLHGLSLPYDSCPPVGCRRRFSPERRKTSATSQHEHYNTKAPQRLKLRGKRKEEREKGELSCHKIGGLSTAATAVYVLCCRGFAVTMHADRRMNGGAVIAVPRPFPCARFSISRHTDLAAWPAGPHPIVHPPALPSRFAYGCRSLP